MKTFFQKLWNDEQAFVRWGAGLLYLFGELLERGVIPTGVSGLGVDVGPFVKGAAVMIATGNFTLPGKTEVTVKNPDITVITPKA